MVDVNGHPVNQLFVYSLSNGEGFLDPAVYWCPEQAGQYTMLVEDNTGGITELDITVLPALDDPPIIALSGGFCLDDSLSNCDRICENSTVTYTTEVDDPSVAINWNISGAESWEANGSEVTVEWGDPGQGLVEVELGESVNAPLSCYVTQLLDFDLINNSGAFTINIQGLNGGPYFVEVVNADGNTQNHITGAGSGSWGAMYGFNTYTVQDIFGNTCTGSFEIVEQQCIFAHGFVAANADQCENCEAEINLSVNVIPDFTALANPPYTYLWSTGATTADLVGLCPGDYTVTITDAIGCSEVLTVPVTCPEEQGCQASSSLCIDILAIPEAAFETNPPAVNGVVEICEGQTVFFENQTNGSFSYTWDFGTGVSSAQAEPEHTYLSPGTYEAVLIARNDCFCADSASVTIIVEEAITPEIDCSGTICPGEEITYTSNADCGTFYWNVSTNGTIISGGGLNDDFITVDWGAGPEGIIELAVDNCSGDYCVQTLFENIPIIDDNAEIRGPSRVCKGTEVLYTMPAYAGTEFIWSVSDFGTITEGQGTNEVSIQWANEITTEQQQVIVEYESCYLGCGGQDTLNVNILNEVFIEGPIEACPDEMSSLNCRTPLGDFVQANWFVYNQMGDVVANSAGAASVFDIDWNVGSGTFIVEAEVLSPSSYCIDNFSVFVDVVPATPAPFAISGASAICPGSNYSYTATSGNSDFSYTWYLTNGTTNSILNGQTINVIWGNTPPYNLELTQTNLEGYSCESVPISLNLSSINSIDLTGDNSACLEEIVTYTTSNYENIDFDWEVIPSGAGSIIAGENTNEVQIQ